jgi:hypothetical protein
VSLTIDGPYRTAVAPAVPTVAEREAARE